MSKMLARKPEQGLTSDSGCEAFYICANLPNLPEVNALSGSSVNKLHLNDGEHSVV